MYTINDFKEDDFVMVNGQYADIIEIDYQDDSIWIRYLEKTNESNSCWVHIDYPLLYIVRSKEQIRYCHKLLNNYNKNYFVNDLAKLFNK